MVNNLISIYWVVTFCMQETTEQHRADIYESLWGEKAGGKVKETTTARDEALEAEHEPDMDEM